jgi:hypothetical protein
MRFVHVDTTTQSMQNKEIETVKAELSPLKLQLQPTVMKNGLHNLTYNNGRQSLTVLMALMAFFCAEVP